MGPDPPDPPKPPDVQERSMELDISQNKRQRCPSPESTDESPIKRFVPSDPILPSVNPSIFVDPILNNPIRYSGDEVGPYIVHVSRVENDPSAGLSIRPIKFGSFLYRQKVPNILRDGVKSVGRNRISVEFVSAEDANNFLSLPALAEAKFKAFIPTYHITRMGIVKGIPVEWTMDDLVECAEFPNRHGRILKARRLNKKSSLDGITTWVPSQTVVLTFLGQVMPSKIYCRYTSLPVEIYHYPTIQCHKCCRFGHIRDQCRSKERCYKCTQNHSGDSCPIQESQALCVHCNGTHFAIDKNCPEHSRQKSIKLLMATEGISFEEASKLTPPVYRPFSETASFVFAPRSQQSPVFPTPSMKQSNSVRQTRPLNKTSYKKTYSIPPRTHAPLGKTYDVAAHRQITQELPSTQPNGCALYQNPDPPVVLSSNVELYVSALETFLKKQIHYRPTLPID
ncbi:uncharacterized protein LOC123699911 [Colias croceus]|uniref:uncharacterized protein LOC123699911 n=1 Tax=Colias crocea TaxID=72248 RepID=UPI001E28046F|nr:uncharacterized protein LOC123699911 [Colias croceus]